MTTLQRRVAAKPSVRTTMKRFAIATLAAILAIPVLSAQVSTKTHLEAMQSVVIPLNDASQDAFLVTLDWTGNFSLDQLGPRAEGWGRLPSAAITTWYVTDNQNPPGDYLIAEYFDVAGIKHTIQTPIEGDEAKARAKHRKRLADSVRDYPPRPVN